jgi:hypothetical protein
LKKYSKRQVADALRKAGGRVTIACQYLEETYGKKITRDAIYKLMQSHPDLKEIREWAVDRIVDIAEQNLWKSVRSGNVKDSRYVLNSLGRGRGYGVQRLEHANPDGSPITPPAPPTVDQLRSMTREQLDDLFRAESAEG